MSKKEKLTDVPWSSPNEWESVKQKINGRNAVDLVDALNRMRVWILRCESKKCPVYVEATMYLLKATLSDEDKIETAEKCSLYAEAINKFVQLILDRSQKQSEPLDNKAMAVALGIPPWIVDVRNDAIHHFRCGLPLFRATAGILLSWLKENYWGLPEEQDKAAESIQKKKLEMRFETFWQEYVGAMNNQQMSELEFKSYCQQFEEAVQICPDIVIKYIVDSEALVTIEALKTLEEIPESIAKLWTPIFFSLNRVGKLNDFFVATFKTLNSALTLINGKDVEYPMRCVLYWLTSIVRGDLNDSQNDLTGFIDLKPLLKAAMTVISTSTMDVIELIARSVRPPFNQQKVDLLLKMYTVYSGERVHMYTKNFDKLRIATVEDLISLRAKKAKLECKKVPCKKNIDWSTVPLGVLPQQWTVPNLKLDIGAESDYISGDLKTEDEEVLDKLSQVHQMKKGDNEIRMCDEELYEKRRRRLSQKEFSMWKFNIPLEEMEYFEE